MDVSIIIPTKNREHVIERAINSVYNQTVKNIELIVVDDGSSDNTSKILQKYINNEKVPFSYIKNNVSVGGAVARNQGAEIAKGKFIAFLDSDDEWKSDHLQSGLEKLKTLNGDGVYGNFNVINNNFKRNFNRKLQPKPKDISFAEYILSGLGDTRTSTFIFKKNCFDKVKFDNKQAKHQDWDLAIRFSEANNFIFNDNTSVNLYEDIDNRMSYKMNHEATGYFLSKHFNKIKNITASKFYLSLAKNTLVLEGKNNEFYKYKKESIISLTKDNEKRGIEVVKIYLQHCSLSIPREIFISLKFIKQNLKKVKNMLFRS